MRSSEGRHPPRQARQQEDMNDCQDLVAAAKKKSYTYAWCMYKAKSFVPPNYYIITMFERNYGAEGTIC